MAFQIGLLFLLKHKIFLFHLLSFVFIRFITLCHSLSRIVILCHLLYAVPLVAICCITRCRSLCYSMSFVATRYHSMPIDIPLVCLFITIIIYKFLLFTSEHLYMRPEVNSNRFKISLRSKISLRCKVTSLCTFT